MAHLSGLAILLATAAALLLAALTWLLVRAARRPPRHTAGWAVARGMACDPGDLGLAHESWTLDVGGGVHLPVWEIPRAGGGAAATGLTAVIVHGWGQSRIDMLGRLEPWDGACDRVVLYDLRGHGDAEGSVSDLGHGEEADLLALLDRVGPGRVILVGHSLGAVIAVRAAAADAPAARSVAGVVAYGVYDDFHRSLRGRLRAEALPVRPVSDLAVAWLRLLGVRGRCLREAAAALPCPLLVIHGTRDEIAPLASAERLVDLAADAILHRVEGAMHGEAYGLDRAEHDRAARAFVDRVAAS